MTMFVPSIERFPRVRDRSKSRDLTTTRRAVRSNRAESAESCRHATVVVDVHASRSGGHYIEARCFEPGCGRRVRLQTLDGDLALSPDGEIWRRDASRWDQGRDVRYSLWSLISG